MQTPPVRSTRAPFLALLASLPLTLACPPAGDTDAGTSDDAGASGDAGSTDAGIDDAGSTDAGSDDAGSTDDGGTPDAGDPCTTATYDDALGTLSLESGFTVVDHAPLPATAIAVAPLVGTNDEVRIAALDVASETVVDLGAWPDLDESSALLDVVPADETSEDRYLSAFLASNGAIVAAGYTLPFDPQIFAAPGTIAMGNASEVDYLSADNNFSGAFLGDALLVNGSSAEAAAAGTGLYAIRVGDAGLEGVAVATFPDDWFASSGYTAVTSGDVVVVGGFYAIGDDAPTNHLVAVAPADVEAALTSAEPVDLGDAPLVLSGGMLGASAFGDGVAVIRGEYGAPVEGVLRVGLSVGAGGAVSAAEPAFVLRASDSCTWIDLLASTGDDLLVGVTDTNGRRLVRVRQDG